MIVDHSNKDIPSSFTNILSSNKQSDLQKISITKKTHSTKKNLRRALKKKTFYIGLLFLLLFFILVPKFIYIHSH